MLVQASKSGDLDNRRQATLGSSSYNPSYINSLRLLCLWRLRYLDVIPWNFAMLTMISDRYAKSFLLLLALFVLPVRADSDEHVLLYDQNGWRLFEEVQSSGQKVCMLMKFSDYGGSFIGISNGKGSLGFLAKRDGYREEAELRLSNGDKYKVVNQIIKFESTEHREKFIESVFNSNLTDMFLWDFKEKRSVMTIDLKGSNLGASAWIECISNL